MTIKIETLSAEHQPFLWEMLYQALFVPEGEPPLPRELVYEPELAKYVAGWGRDGDLGVVAMLYGADGRAEPVGAAWLRCFSLEQGSYGFVDEQTPELSIALLPDYRGQGVGSGLLTELFRRAGERYGAVSLSVSLENPAKGLYERLGFKLVGLDAGGSAVMVKTL